MKSLINKASRRVFLSFTAVLLTMISNAQDNTVKGYVLNKTDMSPIDNCNVAIEGAPSGTITDNSGFFSLTVKPSESNSRLAISFVGYKKVVMPVSLLLDGSTHTILMVESKTELANVVVSADALVERMYIRKAVDNIKRNYIQKGVSYKGSYTSRIKNEFGERVPLSGDVRIDDKLSYRECTPESAYRDVLYSFNSVNSDKKNGRINFNINEPYMDALLSCDIVRNGTMIMDLASLSDFTLSKGAETDEDYTIIYEAINPNFIMSYDFRASKITGRIVISKNDYAVLKNECWISSNTPDLKRRTLISSEMTTTREYYGSIEYRKYSWGYAPWKYIFRTNEEQAELGIEDFSAVLNESLKSRQYYLGETSFSR